MASWSPLSVVLLVSLLASLVIFLLERLYSHRILEFRLLHPAKDLAEVRAELAGAETQLTIVSDLAELVAWFTTRPRTRSELIRTVRLILEASCQGVVFSDRYTRGRLLEWDGHAGELVQLVEYHDEGVPAFKGTRFPPGFGAPGMAFSSGEVVVVDDFAEAFPDAIDPWDRPYRSVLCIPVPTSPFPDTRIGVLNYDSPIRNYFRGEHVRFLRAISGLVYVALNHGAADESQG